MAQAITSYYEDPAYAETAGAPELALDQPVLEPTITVLPRSKWMALPFLVPILLCGASYLAGGQPFVTDVGFVVLTALCGIYIVRELMVFPQRFGIGALILYGGTLIWFCFDYLKHWLGIRWTGLPVEPWVVAKAAYYHCIFVFFMVLGLQIKKGRWLERVLHAVPDPKGNWLYFLLVIIVFLIGMIPFVFFAEEPFYIAIYKSFWGGRGGEGATFTAGRTGNLNFQWSGYVAQLADVGMMGSILAAFCAIVVRMPLWQKIVCWGIWVLWLCVSFGTGTRGFVVFLSLPVIMVLFLKHSYRAALLMRRMSLKGYAITIVVGLVVLMIVQVQGYFRNSGFEVEQFTEVDVTALAGNEMFTTSIIGMGQFPDSTPFFYDRIPGEGLVRAIPEETVWLFINIIPRALWNNKPIDQAYIWYNNASMGKDVGAEGTTISNGAVGHPYIRFGPFGVIEFGILYGWAMGVVERALLRGIGRPMAILFTLAFATFIFRSFRDLWWHNLYPIIIAGVVVYAVVWVCNSLFGGSDDQIHAMSS